MLNAAAVERTRFKSESLAAIRNKQNMTDPFCFSQMSQEAHNASPISAASLKVVFSYPVLAIYIA